MFLIAKLANVKLNPIPQDNQTQYIMWNIKSVLKEKLTQPNTFMYVRIMIFVVQSGVLKKLTLMQECKSIYEVKIIIICFIIK